MPFGENYNPAKPAKSTATSSGGFGSAYNSGGTTTKRKKKGRGFVSRFAHDLEQAAVNSPGGLYAAGKALVEPTYQDLRHGPSSVQARKARANQQAIATGLVTQPYHDFQHPLRHPGNTLLDVIALASLGGGTAARVAATGKAIRTGEGVGRAIVKGPRPQARVIKYQGNEVVSGSYSKVATTRAAQKLLDKAREAFPDTPIVGRSQVSRFGVAERNQRVLNERLARVDAATLRGQNKKLSAGKQMAIRVQAEGVPTADRIAYHQQQLDAGTLKPRLARKTKQAIVELQAAQKYLDELGGKPVINEPGLAKIYQDAKAVADERTRILNEAGVLSGAASENRVAAPGEIIRVALARGNTYGGGQGEFRVPYATKAPKGSLEKIAGSGQGRMVGVAQKPGSLTHSFEGGILEKGGGRNDVTTLVAESNIEAQRYTHLVSARERIAQLAHDDPNAVPEAYRVGVNLGVLTGNRVPQAARDILDKATGGAKLSDDEVAALGQAYDNIREEIFPPKGSPLERVPGIKWVDQRLLGGLDKQNPLIGFNAHGSLRRGLNLFDQINSAQKLAILYLKPAYAVPNLLGNAALTLIQQGFAAPRNLVAAARLNSKIGYKAARAVDEVMGEGIFGVLHDEGFLKRINNLAAGSYGKIVDRPFRRSSFLHEARRQGYTKPTDINRLLFDESARTDLVQVAQRANAELIDYVRLGPNEKNIIARVIFFYPWVKGSTVYAARILGEHPVTAAVMGQLGQLGHDIQQQQLGDLPPYYQGLIRTGGTDTFPRVVNPASAAILQTPADVVQSLLGVAGQGQGGSPAANLTPALAAVYTLLSGNNTLGYKPPGQSPGQTALKGLYEGLPAYQLQRRLRGQQTSKTSSYSQRDALMKFLLGTTPFTINRAAVNKQAKK